MLQVLSICQTCRPPGIYKVDYIEELYRRYDDINDMPLPPERPDWCRGNLSAHSA